MQRYHSRDSRAGYEFEPETKWEIKKSQEFKCAWPGCNKPIEEIHHWLPIAVARKYFPHVLHLVMLPENGMGLCAVHHKKWHKESHDYGEISKQLYQMTQRVRA